MSWNVPAVEGGDPEKFAQLLVDNDFEAVCLKAANGNALHYVSRWSPWPLWGENIRIELMNALRAAKIKVYFWHFMYGYDPSGELNRAISQCARFEPDGYIWDVEGAFDTRRNAEANARLISKGLKRAFPAMPQGLCWWALPKSPTTGSEWHPVKVAKAFFETVDVGMPMMYWQGSYPYQAIEYLYKSLEIWQTITALPLVPIGRAYNGDGGKANSPSIESFAKECFASRSGLNQLLGNSWWSLDKAWKQPEWLEVLKAAPRYNLEVIDPVVLSIEEKVARLAAAHPDLFPELVF